MNISRRGKIARLPLEIRHQLNTRFRNGEPGKHLVRWLNSLPEVQAVMAVEFGGRTIQEQNLSAWKQGGYLTWLQQQETLEMAAPMAAELEEAAQVSGASLTDKMAVWLTMRYVMADQKRDLAGENIQDAWNRLREICSDLVALRRGDHNAARLKLEQEKLGMARHNEQSKALEYCLELAKDYPEVMAGFQSTFKLFEERRYAAPADQG